MQSDSLFCPILFRSLSCALRLNILFTCLAAGLSAGAVTKYLRCNQRGSHVPSNCDSLSERLVIESGSSPGSQNERHITSLSLCGNKHNCGWNDNVTPAMCCNVGRHTPTRAEPVRRLEQRAPSYTANGYASIIGQLCILCQIMDACYTAL